MPIPFENIQNTIKQVIDNSPAADINENVKSFVANQLAKMGWVTREEYEIQCAMVEKLRARVDALEAQLKKGE